MKSNFLTSWLSKRDLRCIKLPNVPIQWHWHPDFEVQNGAIKAFFVVNVPENETPESRTISAQISIDNKWNEGYHIEEEDEHDWGEWITILSGIQDGK